MNKIRFHLTASEIAMGRVMRAPDHPAEGGGEAAPADAGGDSGVLELNDKVSGDTDDFAAFEKAQSFGDVDSPAPEADADGEQPSAEGEDSQQEPEPEKKGKSAQERIDELTATAREAERRAAEAERKLRETEEAKEPKEEATPLPEGLLEGEPDPKDYEYGEADSKYIKDSATFHAEVAYKRQKMLDDMNTQFKAIDEGYQERAEKAVERYPDFEEKVVKGAQGETPTWVATPVMSLAMKTSDVGPDVAYHLATNPEESKRIAALSPLEQAREMGRLEGKFTYQEKPPAKKVSEAPEPPTQVTKGAGGKFKVSEDTDDFTAFDKSYKSQASGG
jgi:hypothetical protein